MQNQIHDSVNGFDIFLLHFALRRVQVVCLPDTQSRSVFFFRYMVVPWHLLLIF